jgi:hypothetical protein
VTLGWLDDTPVASGFIRRATDVYADGSLSNRSLKLNSIKFNGLEHTLIFGASLNSGGSNYGKAFGWVYGGGECDFGFAYNSGTSIKAVSFDGNGITIPNSLNTGERVFAATLKNLTSKAYCDGVYVGQAIAASALNRNYPLRMFSDGNSRAIPGGYSFAMVFSRALSPEEIKSISENPWQIYEPETVYKFQEYTPVQIAQLIQAGYRFRRDDGSEVTATWLANQNTELTNPSGPIRLRILIDSQGDNTGKQFQLEYRKVGTQDWIKV